MKKLLLRLSLTVKQNVLSVFALLCLLPAVFSGGIAVANPNAGKVWTEVAAQTADIAGSKTRFSGRLGHATVVFKDAMWVIGGMVREGDEHDDRASLKNDVWRSTDGITWKQVTGNAAFSERFGHAAVVFNNAMWVISGYGSDYIFSEGPVSGNNDVWRSTDGITWKQVTGSAAFSGRLEHTAVVFNNAMWVIGGISSGKGNKNDVWSSTDGANWTEVTTGITKFYARFQHTATVFKNALWVIGGNDGNAKNYVWKSTNGRTWVPFTATGIKFPVRDIHTAKVFNNALWVIAGYDGPNGLNKVWKSNDGMTWTEVAADTTTETRFSRRFGHATVVFKNALWVIGGYDHTSSFNDVWRSP